MRTDIMQGALPQLLASVDFTNPVPGRAKSIPSINDDDVVALDLVRPQSINRSIPNISLPIIELHSTVLHWPTCAAPSAASSRKRFGEGELSENQSKGCAATTTPKYSGPPVAWRFEEEFHLQWMLLSRGEETHRYGRVWIGDDYLYELYDDIDIIQPIICVIRIDKESHEKKVFEA
ncbi:unnamed protein product [Ceratitis capitata]|uniref:(Mediterranean fruit fly) hypothetical protein n=1 Tax=Ceratitis capitata TaxID=7213 RepID=A0A811UYM7_CERCA|nr:unnamed protein product [Ceratitis capitata]